MQQWVHGVLLNRWNYSPKFQKAPSSPRLECFTEAGRISEISLSSRHTGRQTDRQMDKQTDRSCCNYVSQNEEQTVCYLLFILLQQKSYRRQLKEGKILHYLVFRCSPSRREDTAAGACSCFSSSPPCILEEKAEMGQDIGVCY